MKTQPATRPLSSIAYATALAFCLAGSGCGRNTGQPINSQITKGAGVAEPLARELVAKRGLPVDYGLLGDVLMEQGQLAEATDAYQRMIDLRPDLHSYARGAHIRWLKGDLTGAVELVELAASASSPLDPESAAWVHTRLAFYRFQAGALSEADRACDQALELQKDYPPALLLRGRIRLAEGNGGEAIEVLQTAAKRNPLPEY